MGILNIKLWTFYVFFPSQNNYQLSILKSQAFLVGIDDNRL